MENPNEGIGSNDWNRHGTNGKTGVAPLKLGERPAVHESTTLGWSDCGHDSWRPGLVLDPFAGSGTTLAVATYHGYRSAIGIDLDERNAELAVNRIGPLLVEVTA